jgi:exoribonuclease-2
LGIDCYIHATSPIRRYLDVALQRQLLAYLQQKPLPYDGPALLELAQIVDANLRSGNRVRQGRQRYWSLKWFQQNQGKTIPALALEQQIHSWQLLLLPLMFMTNIPLHGATSSLAAGQTFMVRILRADPFEDILRIEIA